MKFLLNQYQRQLAALKSCPTPWGTTSEWLVHLYGSRERHPSLNLGYLSLIQIFIAKIFGPASFSLFPFGPDDEPNSIFDPNLIGHEIGSI